MRKPILLLALPLAAAAHAQVTSCASFMAAGPKADVVVPFRYDDPGVQTPMWWGLDMAWISEDNLRTGIFFAGQDVIDYVRLSYQASASVEDGAFSADQISAMESRAQPVLKWCQPNVGIYMEDDNPEEDPWYYASYYASEERGRHWAKVIDMTADYFAGKGLTNLVAIGPFNEPDYAWQGGDTQNDLMNICKALREDDEYRDKYAGVRLYGPSTLNCTFANDWWGVLGNYFDEGNTHQLAGDFDGHAQFFTTVRGEGKYACGDELHNLVECIIGAEYGMQTGIWWGTCEYARSQFMKATTHTNPGSRLAYAENRAAWSAASVYRLAGGQVQAFLGESERQAGTSYYDFVALDRNVWYDGVRGRHFPFYLPGGTGYQTVDQPTADVCINVDGGEDVRPLIEGTYKIVNVNSGLILGLSANVPSGFSSVSQRKNQNTYKFLQWNVYPHRNVVGDFSYYTLELGNDKGMYLDVLNYGYEDGTDVGVYPGSLGTNEQWQLEYAGNGAFYILCRSAAKCLEVANSATFVGANVQIATLNGGANQQWKLIATDVTPDTTAPAAPSGLRTTLQNASVKLTWQPVEDDDLLEYCVVRNGSLLARGLTETEITDNEAEQDSTYSYHVYAIDKSYNYSEPSNEVTANVITDERGEVMHLSLASGLWDTTDNGNHSALYGEASFVTNRDHQAFSLSGEGDYLQLPYTVASHDAITVACWLCPRGGDAWQRVFDFGNGTDQYMFLTTNCGSGVRFAIKDGGDEETVDAGTRLTTTRWYHIAVTLDGHEACIYINGELKGSNENISIKPTDFRPALNYVGRSQYPADPTLKAYLHDFTVYNYALTADEVAELTTGIDSPVADTPASDSGHTYDLSGRIATGVGHGITIHNGKKSLK